MQALESFTTRLFVSCLSHFAYSLQGSHTCSMVQNLFFFWLSNVGITSLCPFACAWHVLAPLWQLWVTLRQTPAYRSLLAPFSNSFGYTPRSSHWATRQERLCSGFWKASNCIPYRLSNLTLPAVMHEASHFSVFSPTLVVYAMKGYLTVGDFHFPSV